MTRTQRAQRVPTIDEAQVETTGGTLRVRSVGTGVTTLFVHGLLVNGHVWDPLIPHLHGCLRMVMPDLPLGGHHVALAESADCTLEAHAQRVIALARQLPGPILLVGSDTGGAIAQLAVSRAPELFDRLVLLPSDAFENCPPKALVPMRWIARVPGAVAVIASALRIEWIMRLMLKLVARARMDRAQLDQLIGQFRSDPAVQRDLRKLLEGLRPDVTMAVATELHHFQRPVLIAWTEGDLLFPTSHATRLASCFPKSSVELTTGSRAFVSLDQPEWLAARISDFIAR